eukprot:9687734-Prorocentrum_lima.AAC.1
MAEQPGLPDLILAQTVEGCLQGPKLCFQVPEVRVSFLSVRLVLGVEVQVALHGHENCEQLAIP